MSLVQTIAPENEPITLEEAKAHCNIESDFVEDDDLIEGYIAAARESCEAKTGRQLVPATYALRLSGFPCGDTIELPKPPLVSVSGITYVDGDGEVQTLSTDVYEHDPYTTPGRVVLKYGENWPTTRSQRNAVTITFVAGYEPGDGDVSTVPKLLKQGMLMRIAHWNENREETIAGTIIASVPSGADYCDRLYRFSGALDIDELGLND
jgi:uncharacterized phiE125 gp8 family phage protein